jgi:acetylornithine deacetylase/succinyl-diaminopimelate desuccinylase-like protein
MGEETAVAGTGLGSEAADLVSELIRIDTVNPPGGEQLAQELLASRLSGAGFECTLLAAKTGRANLVARLPGAQPGKTLCLLGHVDTVPADRSEWSFDPWSGEIVGGEVRGRGGQDMKGQLGAEVSAAAALAGDGWRPARGELKLVVTADEETGGDLGAQWLCREHPEAVRADLVVNEGGGGAFELGDRRFYSLCVGEKGVCRFLLRARGTAGHASVPALGENALLKLAPVIERLREQPRLQPTEEGLGFLAAMLETEVEADPTALAGALERLRGLSPALAELIAEPMLRVTMVPTVARASQKENVIPSSAEVLVDCRVPPGEGVDEVRERIDEMLGPLAGELEVEFTERTVGNRSPVDTPLAAAIAAWLADVDPEATLVPMVFPGFSDSHWFREAFGSTVYGFCPQRQFDLFDSLSLMHSADERAAIADLELAAGFYTYLCRRLLG